MKNNELLRKKLLELLIFVENNNSIDWLPSTIIFGRTKNEAFNELFEEITNANKNEVPQIIINLFFNCKTNILGDRTSNNIVFPAFLIKSLSTSGSYITVKLTNNIIIEFRERDMCISYYPNN